MTIALVQFASGEDKQANLRAIRDYAQNASQNGASMLFFPEYSMFYAKMNRRSRNAQAAEPLSGPFVVISQRFADEAYRSFGPELCEYHNGMRGQGTLANNVSRIYEALSSWLTASCKNRVIRV